MANYEILKNAIQNVVKTNGNNEITGALLQQSLLAMIDSLGGHYMFADVATPKTKPGTPDQNIWYFVSTVGTYSNFGGIVVNDGEICAFCWNGVWTKKILGVASAEQVESINDQINGKIPTEIEITPTSWSTGAIDALSGGQNTTQTNYIVCGYYNIENYATKDLAKLILTMPVRANAVNFGLAFYSSPTLSAYISGSKFVVGDGNGIQEVEIDIPPTAKFFRTTFWATNQYGEFSAKVFYKEQGRTYEERLTELEISANKIELIDEILPRPKNYLKAEIGYINPGSGVDVSDATHIRTDFVPMNIFANFVYFDQAFALYYQRKTNLAFNTYYYDADKNYLGYSQLNIENGGHSVDDVAFIRFSIEGTDIYGLMVCVDNTWYSTNKYDVAAYSDVFTDAAPIKETAHLAVIEELDSNKVNVPTIPGLSNPYIIRITSQAQFNDVKNLINSAISLGETNILVYLSADKLYFADGLFLFIASQYPNAGNVNIEIRASQNCKIIASATPFSATNATPVINGRFVFDHSAAFDYKRCYFTGDKEISLLSEIRQFDGIAIATGNSDGSGNLEYKIKLPDNDMTEYHGELMIQIFHAYRGKFFPVNNIVDGYVYFYDIYGVDRNIAISITNRLVLNYRWCNSMDGDVYVSNGKIYFDVKYQQIEETNASHIFRIETFKSVTISGLNLYFSSDNESEPHGSYTKIENALIRINDFNTSNDPERFVRIVGNHFFNIRNVIVRSTDNSNNIIFANNFSENCYKTECSIGNNIGGYIVGNKSINGNRYIDHYAVFHCASKQKGLIADNIIVDFAYSAIRSGGGVENTAANVIIERNVIEYSDEYANNEFHLGDCGAIYAYREASLLIVRDNIVLNYRGQSYTIGIYMDGYISNAKVYRNLIINTFGRYIYGRLWFYDISFAADNNDTLQYTGKNRFCGLNILTGRVFMQNRNTDTESIMAMNIEVHADKTNNIPDRLVTVATVEEPFHIYNATIMRDKIMIPVQYYGTLMLRKYPFNRQIMQRILFNKN